MSTKGEDHRERKKNRGMASASEKTRPPDKKKLDRKVTTITNAIKEKERSLKCISSSQKLGPEIERLTAGLAEDEKQKRENTAEVERIEKEIKTLGLEVISKKAEASKLIAGVRHKTEEKIDEAVGKLELKLHTRKFTAPEERKLRQEMDSLIRSKEPLRAYYKVKTEIDEMRTKQESLRKQRDSLYRANGELRERIGATKDSIAEKKAENEESKKEASLSKEIIEKEIDELKQQRRLLHEEFREKKLLYSQAATEEREHQREEKRQSETRHEERFYRNKVHLDVFGHRPRRLSYHKEKQTCSALISYIEKLSLSHSTNDTPPSPSPLRPQMDQSTLTAEKPGEFLPRKGGEEEGAVLIPASSRKKSKRDKRRHTISSKAGRKLNHNALTLQQFAEIGLHPPITSFDLQPVLAQLQEKLTFYVSKSQSGMLAESEAGDSGVGSVACSEFPDFSDADLPPSLTISQEDISSEVLLSPRRSLSDSNGTPKVLAPDRSLTDDVAGRLARENSMASHSSSNSLVPNVVLTSGIDE